MTRRLSKTDKNPTTALHNVRFVFVESRADVPELENNRDDVEDGAGQLVSNSDSADFFVPVAFGRP